MVRRRQRLCGRGGARPGVGSRLYAALLAILRLQGHHAAFAGIAQPNAASVALHEAAGFTPVGVYREVGYKLGAWRDVGWWGLILSSGDGPPADPVPLPALAPDLILQALQTRP